MWITLKKLRQTSLLTLGFITFFSITSPSAQENFSELYGLWQWDKTKILVHVDACSYNPAKMCAIISQGENKGTYILRSIAKQDGKFIGKMIHPVDGRAYDADIKLKADSTVEISGCTIGKSSCQVSTWHRITK